MDALLPGVVMIGVVVVGSGVVVVTTTKTSQPMWPGADAVVKNILFKLFVMLPRHRCPVV